MPCSDRIQTAEDIKTTMMIMLIVEHSVSTDKSCPVVRRTQQKHNKAIRDIYKKCRGIRGVSLCTKSACCWQTDEFYGVRERLLRKYILPVCGRALLSLGTEFEKALKWNCLFRSSYALHPHLECWCMTWNEFLGIPSGSAIETTDCHRYHFVVNNYALLQAPSEILSR